MRQKKSVIAHSRENFSLALFAGKGVKQSGKLYVLPLLSLSLSRFFALSRVPCLPPSRFQRLFVLPLPLTGPIFISSQEVFKQSYVLSFDNCMREFAINRPWKKLRIYHGGPRGALIKYFDLWNAFFYRYRSKGKKRREEKEGEEGRERKRREKDEESSHERPKKRGERVENGWLFGWTLTERMVEV